MTCNEFVTNHSTRKMTAHSCPLSPKLFATESLHFFEPTSPRTIWGRGAGTGRHRQNPDLTENARDLRARQTEAESLLWAVLRGRRLCGLKFRRQYPIEPFIADFACIEKKLIIEIDGGYHDCVFEEDKSRQKRIESEGWDVIRFSNEDVLGDVEAVAIAIARHLKLEPVFRGRNPLTPTLSPEPLAKKAFRYRTSNAPTIWGRGGRKRRNRI